MRPDRGRSPIIVGQLTQVVNDDGPVFLCGGDRSGVGLVGEMLEMHPSFAITRRTNFFAYYADRFLGLSSMADAEEEMKEMLRDRRFKLFEQDAEDALAGLSWDQLTPARLFEELQHRRMNRLGRRRWGDKSLWSEQYADVILASYPTAVMVHVVRDPRDQFASYKYYRRNGAVAAGVGAAMLRRSMKFAERNSVIHDGRYLVVRYEDLATDPHHTLSTLCAFLGEEFSTVMLDEPEGEDGTSGEARTIHTASVGRYRSDLTDTEAATIERLVGSQMVQFGYMPATELGAYQRLAFIGLRLPISMMQAAAWNARSRLRRARGLGPSRSRLSD